MSNTLSSTEENYIKAIFKLSDNNTVSVSTNAIAESMQTAAASVTDMLKRLTEKGYVLYEKYKGARLSEDGKKRALLLLRKHRLWEAFMVDKLGFSWDEIHPIAEQLEHIQSEKLINQLDEFLGFPKVDPHGDPIPDKEGNYETRLEHILAEVTPKQKAVIVGVKEHSKTFLKYLEQLNLLLGTRVEILQIIDYDKSLKIRINEQDETTISNKVAQNLYIKYL